MNQRITIVVRNLFTILLALYSAYGFSQTREEVTAQLSSIIRNSSYSDELQYYNNTISSDCNTLTHAFDTYQSITFTRTEKFSRVENSYKNIPWQNLEFMTTEKIRTSVVYLFFNTPIVQKRKLTYGSYFRNKYSDGTIERTVRSIQLHISNKDLPVFERLCFKLKFIDSSLREAKGIPAIQTLPVVTYSQKVLPPTGSEAWRILDGSTSTTTCGPSEWPEYWCKFFSLRGIDIKKMSTEEMKNSASTMQEYWNKYCYSFSTKSSVGGQLASGGSTLLEVSNDYGDNSAFGLIAYRIKGNTNLINPFTGKTYFDNLCAAYGKEEHSVDYRNEEIDSKWRVVESRAKRWGCKPSSYMLQQYKYDPKVHNELIEAIVCNSQGEGVFAGLRNDPAQYLLYMYNVGIRNFDEAVFLFENIYRVTIPSTDKAQFRKTINGLNLGWD